MKTRSTRTGRSVIDKCSILSMIPSDRHCVLSIYRLPFSLTPLARRLWNRLQYFCLPLPYTDRIEWIDDARTCSTAVVSSKSNDPGIGNSTSSSSSSSSPARLPAAAWASLPFSLSRCGMLRLARPERRRLHLLSILIPHLFGLGCRSISNLGLLDSIGK